MQDADARHVIFPTDAIGLYAVVVTRLRLGLNVMFSLMSLTAVDRQHATLKVVSKNATLT